MTRRVGRNDKKGESKEQEESKSRRRSDTAILSFRPTGGILFSRFE